MTNLEENPKIRAAMDKVLKIFESGGLEIVTRAIFTAQPGYEKPSDRWSFMNRILMMAEDTEDARTYNQWKQVGRYVKKGTHAFSIFKPLTKKIRDDKKQEEKVILYGFGTVPEFKYEDTEGAEIQHAPEQTVQIPCNYDEIIKELNLTIRTSVFNGSSYGYFSPHRHIISLSSPDTEIFLHELSHAVDNKVNKPLKGGQHKDQEVVAEFSAAVIGHMMGFNVALGNCKQYIEHYSFKELMSQLNRCEKVIKFVMERTVTTTVIPSFASTPAEAAA